VKRGRSSFLALGLIGSVALLAAVFAASVPARESARAAGATRIVFVYGQDKACKKGKDHVDCSHPRDVIRSISPSGSRERELASVRSVVELSATKDGRTVAILSKNVVGGGSNTGAYTQIYLLSPSGKLKPVFAERLQQFAANGLAISANGKLLVFSGKGSRSQGFPKGSKVFLVRSDGSGMRQLSKGEGDDVTPAFSPDGKRVVFSREPAEGSKERDSELYEVAIVGGGETRLTEDEVDDVNPVFSPNGKVIAFGQYGPRRGKIVTMPATGGAVRTVVSTGREYPDPDYSPNGRNLVFPGELNGDSPLTTVRATGGAKKIVTKKFDFPGLPQWTSVP
jgi:dipeptidyl aminopeptidase/acylaminoacyl peptidase